MPSVEEEEEEEKEERMVSMVEALIWKWIVTGCRGISYPDLKWQRDAFAAAVSNLCIGSIKAPVIMFQPSCPLFVPVCYFFCLLWCQLSLIHSQFGSHRSAWNLPLFDL